MGSLAADCRAKDCRSEGAAVASLCGGTPSDPMRGEKYVRGTNCVSFALVMLATLRDMWSNILRNESAYAMAAKGSDGLNGLDGLVLGDCVCD